MAQLEALASITRLSDHVVRVLGQNPGKFTLQGTNTYIIGEKNPYTLIDTGEGKEEYIPVLASALRETAKPSTPTDPDVSDIILSHKHKDHVGGLPSILSLLRQLWDERNVNGSGTYKPPRVHIYGPPDTALQSIIDSLPANLYTTDTDGRPIHDLKASKYFLLATELSALSSTPALSSPLQMLHTPGHTPDSIAIYIPSDDALYTADTVLGQGTAVFEDLASLITSLRKMHDFAKSRGNTETKLYPGHGPVVEDGRRLIMTYIQHRRDREEEIVRVLGSDERGMDGMWTTWTIVSKIYAAYPQNLWLPAAHSVDLHLKKLQNDGRVRHVGGQGNDGQWELIKEQKY